MILNVRVAKAIVQVCHDKSDHFFFKSDDPDTFIEGYE